MTPTLTPDQLSALRLLSNGGGGKGLLPRAHAIINANVKALLEMGLVDYTRGPRAYRLTAKGWAAL